MQRAHAHRTGALWVSLALVAGFGCGGHHDGGSAADAAGPSTRATRTPASAGFTATVRRTDAPAGTPTVTGAQAASTATPTPEWTPVIGTTTVTPTRTPIPAPQAVLRIARVSGAPGTVVSVDVTLDLVAPGVDIAGTENDFFFAPAAIAVVDDGNGEPACAVNPEIGKAETQSAFQPPYCRVDDGSCNGVRALVLSFENTLPIPPGARLYTCSVAISADASPGTVYPLSCPHAAGSSPAGDAILMECEDGAIEVTEAR